MSTSSITVPSRRDSVVSRALDYLELTKPKIALLELVTLATAALLAGVQPWLLLHALVGTTLVAASASALNQWLEQHRDCLMDRTANRPLPAGRLGSLEVVAFGTICFCLGVAYLAFYVNGLTAILGFASWFLYVVIYTPLKARSSANTFVGAVAGALPILMGWTAMGKTIDLRAFTLFLIVFLWQFPHFMAIAWMYRKQYRAAGMQMLTVVDPTGVRAGGQAVLAALALVPVSMIPAILPFSGSIFIYSAAVLLLGFAQLACALLFLLRLDHASARRLLHASLIYLPALMLLFLLVTPQLI